VKRLFGFGKKVAAAGTARRDLPPSDTTTYKTAAGSFEITGPRGDRTIMQQLIQSGRYEDHVLRLLQRLCRKDSTVLDVGANVGVHALPLSRMARHGTVHAFEACGDTFAFLNANVQANEAKNVILWNSAVCSVDGQTIDISYSPAFAGGAFVSTNGYTEHNVQRVPTVTLDGWADRVRPTHIDLIKMDIEGAEWMALAGAQRLIDKFRPTLIVECNASTLCRWHDKSPADLFRAIREQYPFIAAVIDQEDAAVCGIESEQDLNALIETGKGLEDLLCSFDQPDLPRICLDDYLARMRKLFGRVNLLPHSDMVVIQDIVFHDPKFAVDILRHVETVSPGERFRITARVRNAGLQLWSNAAPNPVHVSYFWRTADGNEGVRDGLRTMFQEPVKPGDQATLDIDIQAPAQPGSFECCVSLVHEGLCWFDQFHPESAGIFWVCVSKPG
jgi:FkbM family methyltransferase